MLHADGYTADLQLIDDALCTANGDLVCIVGEAVVERLYRFEGPSDPGDQMIVFGVRDPASGMRGTLASAFGIHADPALFGRLSDLSKRFG